MKLTETYIKDVIQDLAEENPLACYSLFSITEIVFTEEVPTLAVSLEIRPTLSINMAFLRKNVQQETDIKCLLMHEFLHVLLHHTEQYETNNPVLNIALDAIINAIIHRSFGKNYTDFFYRYYRKKGFYYLLQPLEPEEIQEPFYREVHEKIYGGKITADDLYELLKTLLPVVNLQEAEDFLPLGNHTYGKISPGCQQLLNEILRKMDGCGIWNRPKSQGHSDTVTNMMTQYEKIRRRDWVQATLPILKSLIKNDPRVANWQTRNRQLPFVSRSDRRKWAHYLLDGILPLSSHQYPTISPVPTVSIYFDVSGSMSAEIQELTALLHHFKAWIRFPLWTFSDFVSKARFENNKLTYDSTGGTSIYPVIQHIKEHRFKDCLIISDGYFEDLSRREVEGHNIQFLLTPDGKTADLSAAGFSYVKLPQL